MILHTFEEALAIARTIQATPDADLHRAATGLSLKAILSLTVLVGQLDAIARAATTYATCSSDHAYDEHNAAGDRLQELLEASGYLPLSETRAKELNHGQS